METAAGFRASFSSVSPNCAARTASGRPFFRVGFASVFSNPCVQQKPLISHMKLGSTKVDILVRKHPAIIASSMLPSGSDRSDVPFAPLQLVSPTGQYLSQVLVYYPHVLPAAVEQQLKQLQIERDEDQDKEHPTASDTDLVLYRRIAEVKAKERRKILEEILYALVVQKFMDADIPLILTISSSPYISGCVEAWPGEVDKHKCLHSPEVYEMIQNHLNRVLGDRQRDMNSVVMISKLIVGQLYAASLIYGYFLKRVDQRFQLEKSIKMLPEGLDREGNNTHQVIAEERRTADGHGKSSRNTQAHPEVSSWFDGMGDGVFAQMKQYRFQTYVRSFDGEMLERYSSIRSKEAAKIVEKHIEALFGKIKIVVKPKGIVELYSMEDESIKISLGGMERLVLEAVTFGSFLWDVESHVDLRYHFVAN